MGHLMANERITESLVRDDLRKLDYYSPSNSNRVEEQKSEIESAKKLLKSASKTGKGGHGAPEFIISNLENPDFLVVVECKAENRYHASQDLSNPVAYAVDGALHYAKSLSKDFNVIAVGVSGETRGSLKVSTYLHPKGADMAQEMFTKNQAKIDKIISWADYIEHATFDPKVQRLRHEELMAFSRQLHEFMRDHAKLTEEQKPLLVSGTLIALRNTAFAKIFGTYKPAELQKKWFQAIEEELENADIPKAKKQIMTQPYSGIAVHPELGKATTKFPKGVLYELINDLNQKVWPFISVYHDFDVVGQFYGEFLKYTGGDKKALGIVLTPRHVTDLFARIANVNKKSVVLDICAGTAGFLVSAMHHMMKDAITDKEKLRIKAEGLIGIEHLPNMYALAASNMILRGDGKANLHQGSCFEPGIMKMVRDMRPDVGMLNPPFSQGDDDLHELVFIKQMLDSLEKKGVGIAIVPMSCAIAPHPMRQELMNEHTLEAVMSMPDELFYPVGTNTCIMVWTAHIPHAESNKKTWFGYWKDDGFVKTKNKGRVDNHERWEKIREEWIESYINREIRPGQSVLKKVTADEEWCAEAYMETDYSTLTEKIFEGFVKNYAIYKLIGARNLSNEVDNDSTQ